MRIVAVGIAALTTIGLAAACATVSPRAIPVPESGSGSSVPSARSGPFDPKGPRTQSNAPFGSGDLSSFYPWSVTTDSHDNVYVTAVNGGVFRLAKGESSAHQVRFDSVDFGTSGGADDAGDIFVADDGNNGKGRVQKLSADGVQSVLNIPGLGQDPTIAVAGDGTVYVADGSNDRVLEVAAGATSATVLPFDGLSDPRFVAVDAAGAVYVSDRGNSRIVTLAPGSTEQVSLSPGTGGQQEGVAVDSRGNVYAVVGKNVVLLPTHGGEPFTIPVSGLSQPQGIGVDSHGTIFIADEGIHRVVELALK